MLPWSPRARQLTQPQHARHLSRWQGERLLTLARSCCPHHRRDAGGQESHAIIAALLDPGAWWEHACLLPGGLHHHHVWDAPTLTAAASHYKSGKSTSEIHSTCCACSGQLARRNPCACWHRPLQEERVGSGTQPFPTIINPLLLL